MEDVGHAQWVFTVPKMLRVHFLYHRDLLGELSRAAAETAKELLAAAAGEEDGLYVEITLEPGWAAQANSSLVTTDLLGRAKVPGLSYLQPDRSPYRLDADYLGRRRSVDHLFPGPFEVGEGGRRQVKVWPVTSAR